MSLIDHFPLVGQTPYPHQREVFSLIEKARVDRPNSKFIILRAPTGSGKSAIAMTLARHAERAHILASHRFLQQQYMDDYAHLGVSNLWGRSNYLCQASMALMEPDSTGVFYSCTQCLATNPHRKVFPEKSTKQYLTDHCSVNSDDAGLCHYVTAKWSARDADISLTNFNSFNAHYNYSRLLGPRPLMVIDEAHLLPDRLVGILTVGIRQLTRKGHAGIYPLPLATDSPDEVANWLEGRVLPEVLLAALGEQVSGAIRYNKDATSWTVGGAPGSGEVLGWVADARTNIRKLLKGMPTLATIEAGLPPKARRASSEGMLRASKLLLQLFPLVKSMRAAPGSWCVEVETRPDGVVFQPVVPGRLAHHMLFSAADEVVLMSATLDNGPFLRDLGIRKEEVRVFIDVPSLLPLQGRPIIYEPVGSMSYADKDATLPKMAARVADIIANRHATNKGIVHCHTFANSTALRGLLPPHVLDRIIWHERDGLSIDLLIEDFFASKDKWLISPSCTEGLDGKGARVRGQIIMKAPYPNLQGGARIKARMKLSDGNTWYALQASNALVQGYGRGCRYARDYCVTYVLDSKVAPLVTKVRKNLPAWFLEAWDVRHPAKWIEKRKGVWVTR